MRERSGHYSLAVQVGLGLSFAVAAGLAIYGAVAHIESDTVRLAIQDLRARAGELVDLIEARQKERLTTPFLRAHLTQWDRAVGDLDKELADAKQANAQQAEARAHAAQMRALGAELRAAPGSANDAAHDAAARILDALIAQERALKQ